MTPNDRTRFLVAFCIFFVGLNVLGSLYPPDGGLGPRLLAAGALTLLAMGFGLLAQGRNREADAAVPTGTNSRPDGGPYAGGPGQSIQ